MQYDPTQETTAARARSIKKLAFLVDELLDRIRGTECKIQDPLSSLFITRLVTNCFPYCT